MAKYISVYNLSHITDIPIDELKSLLHCDDKTSIVQSDIDSHRTSFSQEANKALDKYFNVSENIVFQQNLFGELIKAKQKTSTKTMVEEYIDGLRYIEERKKKWESLDRSWECDDYYPNLDESLNYQYRFFKDVSKPQNEELLFDIECYGNYFLVMFLGYRTGRCWYFEANDEQDLDVNGLRWFVESHTLISFNGIKYDLPMIQIALTGVSPQDLWSASCMLIDDDNGLRPYQVVKKHKGVRITVDHIDLIEVAKGQASLKQYMARLNCPTIQDLPFTPGIDLDTNRQAIVRKYCLNDCEGTAYLYSHLYSAIDLRRDLGRPFGLDLRSKKEAQCAAAILKARIEQATGYKVDRSIIPTVSEVRYTVPDYLCFLSTDLNEIVTKIATTPFTIENDKIQDGVLKDVVFNLGGSSIAMGIGGLHSQEKAQSIYSDDDYMIVDVDVASMYPAMIINQGIYPIALGSQFTKEYTSIRDERIIAKANKDKTTDAGLKLILNSTFGLTGSKYSELYSPQMLIQTTITGQLSLLMLAESFDMSGFTITSVNTDGITVKIKRTQLSLMQQLVAQWQVKTGMKMEYSFYRSTHSASVNNYFAITTDSKIKRKGAYAEPELDKNAANLVCSEAVANYLLHGDDFTQYVVNCKDVTKFLTIKKVDGGAIKDTTFLGKVVRFYHATGTNTAILYAKNGNTVGTSDRCQPMMVLSKTIPRDLDYDWYIQNCKDILKDIGVDTSSIY